MYIEDKIYSEVEDEVYFSMTLNEEEMRLYSEFQKECEKYIKQKKFSLSSYPFPCSSKIKEYNITNKQKSILNNVDWEKVISIIYEYEKKYTKNSLRDFKEGLEVYGIGAYRNGLPYLNVQCKDSSNLLKNYSKMSYWEVDLSESGFPVDVVFGD